MNMKQKIATGLATFSASAMAFAADHSAAIQAAGADGETNVGAAVVTVIAIAAVVTGVGVVLGLLKR